MHNPRYKIKKTPHTQTTLPDNGHHRSRGFHLLSRHISTARITLPIEVRLIKFDTNLPSRKNSKLSPSKVGRYSAIASTPSIATRSSVVDLRVDSRNTGSSDILAYRIHLSSSTETGRNDSSNRGFCTMILYFCSRRVFSTSSNGPTNMKIVALQCSNSLCKHRA